MFANCCQVRLAKGFVLGLVLLRKGDNFHTVRPPCETLKQETALQMT